MTEYLPPGSVHLSTEDRIRMAKLYEEVAGNLEEMSLITARTLNVSVDLRRVVFARHARVDQNRAGDQQVQPFAGGMGGAIGTVFCDCVSGTCGCYDY